MTYKIGWRTTALEKLAAIWSGAPDRQRITDAANEIDELLRRSPLDVGESREEGVRILTVPPLSIYYTVSETNNRVVVLSVWVSSKDKR